MDGCVVEEGLVRGVLKTFEVDVVIEVEGLFQCRLGLNGCFFWGGETTWKEYTDLNRNGVCLVSHTPRHSEWSR